jgi:hypothetical protein
VLSQSIGPDGKELCDLLVVFDDTAIIWQIKDLKVDTLGRYKKSEVAKNIRQLGGARRALFQLKKPITLSNPRRGAELFDYQKISRVHLISVLMGESEEPFPFVQEIKNHRLHVFTRAFADIVLNELDTTADFCAYLRAKEAISDKDVVVQGGEENLLAKYLHAGRSFDWMDQHDLISIDPSVWPAFELKPEVIAKKKANLISAGWDSMIERAHEGSPKYERVARELARPDRFTRRVLSESFFEAYTDFRQSDRDIFRRYMPIGDTSYCFLFTAEIEHPSLRRQQMLEQMCFVARGLEPRNVRVVGVATNYENTGYDFAFLYLPVWTPEDEALKARIQSATGIFAAPRITRTEADETPSPDASSREF